METVIKMTLANGLLLHATIEALLTKGVLSKEEIQSAITSLTYESPVPEDIIADARKLVSGLPGDS